MDNAISSVLVGAQSNEVVSSSFSEGVYFAKFHKVSSLWGVIHQLTSGVDSAVSVVVVNN
jgi:hypothetical protein